MGNTSQEEEVILSPEAYYTAILHSCRYFADQVGGILLGRRASSGELEVIKAVPLFHGNPTSAIFDLGFSLVETFATQNNISIVGYYHANERREDTNLGSLVKQVFENIQQNFAEAVVLFVENSSPLREDSMSAKLFRSTKGSWQAVEKWRLKEERTTLQKLIQLVKASKYLSLNDLENHLDNPANSWLVDVDLFSH